MKKQNIKSNTPVIVLVSVIMAIIGMSFQDTSRTGAPELPKALLDTPKKKNLCNWI